MATIWLSDIHLDSLSLAQVSELSERIAGDIVIVTGDISHAPQIVYHLECLREHGAGVFYVLGNHDFYGGGIANVRVQVRDDSGYLTGLDGSVRLTDGSALIGHDGWYDGRNGNPETFIELNDFHAIDEYRVRQARWGADSWGPNGLQIREGVVALVKRRENWFKVMRELADDAVAQINRKLIRALERNDRVVLATHVPPYAEAATYQGKVSDEQFQPFFSCRALGEQLDAVMALHPTKHLTVLCGHSHGENTYQRALNIVVHTAGADYGVVQVQKAWSLP